MNNETNRLAQLIATAADRELGTRPDGQPRRQDKAAAQAIEAEYLFIRRSELPEVREGRHKDTYVVGGTDITEPNAAQAKRFALIDVAIWQHLEAKEAAHAEAAQELGRRRDELAVQFMGFATADYAGVSYQMQNAINHVIELERNAA